MTGFVAVHGFDLVAIYITGALAFVAGCVNAYLAAQGPRRVRPLFGAIAALAFFYTSAYIILLAGPWPQQQWTRAIRGPSWIVWALVWTYTPWRFNKLAREAAIRTAIKKVEVADVLVAKVAEAIGVEVE